MTGTVNPKIRAKAASLTFKDTTAPSFFFFYYLTRLTNSKVNVHLDKVSIRAKISAIILQIHIPSLHFQSNWLFFWSDFIHVH